MSIHEKLIEIHELIDILGYSDIRSVKKFCEQNKIPLMNLGKKTYTISNFLDLLVANELSKSYSNSEDILNAIASDDKSELARLIEAPVEESVATSYKGKKQMGSAAQKLFDKLNAA